VDASGPAPGDVAAEALAAACAVAAAHGLPAGAPEVLADGANLVVHLVPAPVVAKASASGRHVRDAAEWLAREIAVATALAGAGAPVVAPSPEAPAVVHEHAGVPVTLWTFVPDSGDPLLDPARLGAMLADLHEALRACAVDLPRLAPLLEDVPRFLDRAERIGTPPPRDVAALGSAFARLTAGLPDGPGQPLHGDAHPGNLLAGPVWCDFEDTCRGPVAWDLASLRRTPRLDGAAALRAYARASGTAADDEALAPWLALRDLHMTVWYCLYAERVPALARRAEALLSGWRGAAGAARGRV
jgi:Ser/Thr protein kinase RdoA (MazF antagonist)